MCGGFFVFSACHQAHQLIKRCGSSLRDLVVPQSVRICGGALSQETDGVICPVLRIIYGVLRLAVGPGDGLTTLLQIYPDKAVVPSALFGKGQTFAHYSPMDYTLIKLPNTLFFHN